jgi:membrane protease YdiL (CAAX protease family)
VYRYLLALEYVVLTAGLPLAYLSGWVPLSPIPALWLVTGVCLLVLARSRDFEWRSLWNAERLGRRFLLAAVPLVLTAPLLLLITSLVAPDRWFFLVRQRPGILAMLLILYPVLSVYPQGIVYRTFVFHRYRGIFRSPWARILASAFAFSTVHVIFQNWIAPVLTLVGGVIFGWTYERTRSSLVASLQHALFGCFLFTIGLGLYFFYGGAGG